MTGPAGSPCSPERAMPSSLGLPPRALTRRPASSDRPTRAAATPLSQSSAQAAVCSSTRPTSAVTTPTAAMTLPSTLPGRRIWSARPPPAPTSPSARTFDNSHNGSTDVFVAKLNPTGTALDYLGFLGGTASDVGTFSNRRGSLLIQTSTPTSRDRPSRSTFRSSAASPVKSTTSAAMSSLPRSTPRERR